MRQVEQGRMSPTARSLALLRKTWPLVAITERRAERRQKPMTNHDSTTPPEQNAVPSAPATGSALPCPFCGCAAKVAMRGADGTSTHPRKLYWYVCSAYGCGVGVSLGEWTKAHALERWNKRTPAPNNKLTDRQAT